MTAVGGATYTATPLLISTGPSVACPGDCNSDHGVDVAELISAVNIALGNADITTCTAVDVDGDGDVRINELIAAVQSALGGCAE